MSAYIRIELHERSPLEKPNSAAYDDMHELLSQKGISKTVVVADNEVLELPSGLYFTMANDKQAISKDVAGAARQTGFPFSYVVVLNAGALVYNLKNSTK